MTRHGSVREGDQVRARLMGGDARGEAQRVRSMKVRRTGQTIDFRSATGDLLQTRDQVRLRDGTGDGVPDQDRIRARDRVHEPGTGGGSGSGARGGRGGGGGGGRR